ncbi:hypothetical protein FB451DRAFT_1420837 [Mycena latifolia]|nr:hypothetical protein FB451DRAFT_1420837 [Mycena latifolia]
MFGYPSQLLRRPRSRPRRGAAGDLVIRSRGAASSPELCSPEVKAVLATDEQTFMASLENRQRYRGYRFDEPTGNLTRQLALNDVAPPSGRPSSSCSSWCGGRTRIETRDDQMLLTHGPERGHVVAALGVSLDRGRVGWGITGVVYFEVWTNRGQNMSAGNASAAVSFAEYQAPAGFTRLKGLFGSDRDVVDRIRIGVIWG